MNLLLAQVASQSDSVHEATMTHPYNIFVILFLLIIGSHASRYNGCDHFRREEFGILCDRPGTLKTPAPLGAALQTAPKPGVTAFNVCEYSCFDNINCKSFSWRASDKTCQLYSKNLQDQGFQQSDASVLRFYATACTIGKDVGFPARTRLEDRFNVGSRFFITPGQANSDWDLVQPDRCKDGGEALRVRPAINQTIKAESDLRLSPVGGTFELRYDYMYQNADTSNIMLGYLFQTDPNGGISNVFQLARAEDSMKQGTWQRGAVRFNSVRTDQYRLQIDFSSIPGTVAARRTQWRLDNLVVYQVV